MNSNVWSKEDAFIMVLTKTDICDFAPPNFSPYRWYYAQSAVSSSLRYNLHNRSSIRAFLFRSARSKVYY